MRVPCSKAPFKAHDVGHPVRKTIWVGYLVVIMVPVIVLSIVRVLAEGLETLSTRMYRFAHPCLYVKRNDPRKAGLS